MAILEVQHVSKSFGNTEVLKDISFSLEKGKVPFSDWFIGKRQDYAAAVPEFSGAARRRCDPCKRGDAF